MSKLRLICPNCGFQTDYDEIELKKISYAIISVTSLLLPSPKTLQN